MAEWRFYSTRNEQCKKGKKKLALPLFEVRDDFLDESRGEAGFFSGDESSSAAAWCDVT